MSPAELFVISSMVYSPVPPLRVKSTNEKVATVTWVGLTVTGVVQTQSNEPVVFTQLVQAMQS